MKEKRDTRQWLYPFGYRRRLVDEGNKLGFVPSIPVGEDDAGFYFTEEDGITPINVEHQLIDEQLFVRLPVNKPVYIYYNKVKG